GAEAVERQRLEHVVAHPGHYPAVVQVAHAADEHGHAAESGVGHELHGRGGVQRRGPDVAHLQVEALPAHPPLTGGSTAIGTPGGSGSASRSTACSLANADTFSSSGR